jgi:hypothetical protein
LKAMVTPLRTVPYSFCHGALSVCACVNRY